MIYSCALCGRETEDRAAILAHMVTAHGIANPQERESIELTPDLPDWPEEPDELQPSLFDLER